MTYVCTRILMGGGVGYLIARWLIDLIEIVSQALS